MYDKIHYKKKKNKAVKRYILPFASKINSRDVIYYIINIINMFYVLHERC